jgi:hypothetical protein
VEQIAGLAWLATLVVALVVVAACEFVFGDRKQVG